MKKAIILISALTLSLAASAQTDSKNAVVNVENDYNPIIVKAVKQSFTPQIEMPNIRPMTTPTTIQATIKMMSNSSIILQRTSFVEIGIAKGAAQGTHVVQS